MKKIKSIDDIEVSIHDTLNKYKKISISWGMVTYFWDNYSKLKLWALEREAVVEPVAGGEWVISKFNINN